MTEQTHTKRMEEFENFMKGYTDMEGKYVYREAIEQLQGTPRKRLMIDITHFTNGLATLHNTILDNPLEALEYLKAASKQIYRLFDRDFAGEIEIGVKTLPTLTSLSNVKRSTAIKKLHSVTGYVVSLSEIYVKYKAVYHCTNNHRTIVEEDTAPEYCKRNNCDDDNLTFDSEMSNTIQYGYLIDNNLSDKNAYELKFMLIDDLVNTVKYGELVTLTGIPRLQKQKFQSNTEAVFHVNNIEYLKNESESFTDKEVKEFYSFAQKADAYERLIESVAPSILGWLAVKEGIILQTVSNGKIILANHENIRTNVHVLLVGDPGVAKSQLLAWVANNISGAVLRQANLSSALGLTAGVAKKPDGTVYMSAGAIALASGSTCCIEEFDKTHRDDQEKLYYVMEQQRIPSQKTGAHTDLITDTNLLCDANTKNSYYDSNKPFIDQINFERTLLSRFDLIFLMRDVVNEEHDESIAGRIHGNMSGMLEGNSLDASFVTRYIQYAKTLKPKLPKELAKEATKYYVKARQESAQNTESVKITPRQLESIYRMAFSHAKLLLKKEVDIDDIQHAIIIFTNRLNEIGYAMIVPKSRADRALEIAVDIVRINAEKNEPTSIEEIYNEAKKFCKTSDEHVYLFGDESKVYDNRKLRTIQQFLDKAPNIRVLNDKPRMWTYDQSQLTIDTKEGKT